MELRIYRAVNRLDGRWVIGVPYKSPMGNWFMADHEWAMSHPINPDSIGQDTGLLDCNDRPIFEGDLIRIGRCSRLFEVRYNPRLARYQACAQGSPVTRELKAVNSKSYEIVGNIHEKAQTE